MNWELAMRFRDSRCPRSARFPCRGLLSGTAPGRIGFPGSLAHFAQPFQKFAGRNLEYLRDTQEGWKRDAAVPLFESLPMGKVKAMVDNHVSQGPTAFFSKPLDSRSQLLQQQLIAVSQRCPHKVRIRSSKHERDPRIKYRMWLGLHQKQAVQPRSIPYIAPTYAPSVIRESG